MLVVGLYDIALHQFRVMIRARRRCNLYMVVIQKTISLSSAGCLLKCWVDILSGRSGGASTLGLIGWFAVLRATEWFVP